MSAIFFLYLASLSFLIIEGFQYTNRWLFPIQRNCPLEEVVYHRPKKAKIVGQFAKPPAAEEDLEDTFLKNEFKRISKGKSGITFKQFCRWDELQQLMHDERITLEDQSSS
jgi:hypothetical protein